MASIDPVEAEQIRPAVAKERLRGFSPFDLPAIPGDCRIARMGDGAEIVDFPRFSPCRKWRQGRNDQNQQEKAGKRHNYCQVLNFPESI